MEYKLVETPKRMYDTSDIEIEIPKSQVSNLVDKTIFITVEKNDFKHIKFSWYIKKDCKIIDRSFIVKTTIHGIHEAYHTLLKEFGSETIRPKKFDNIIEALWYNIQKQE